MPSGQWRRTAGFAPRRFQFLPKPSITIASVKQCLETESTKTEELTRIIARHHHLCLLNIVNLQQQ